MCAHVPYVSTASVALAWPRTAIAHLLSGTGFVVARRDSDVRITACTWVSSKWDGRAPEGTALLRAFVGGAHDPRAVDLDDDELIAVARRDLGRVLGIHADPALARVYRWRNAGAQHTVGHADRMAALQDRLSGIAASSSPAAASTPWAFPIASPMRGPSRHRRCRSCVTLARRGRPAGRGDVGITGGSRMKDTYGMARLAGIVGAVALLLVVSVSAAAAGA